MLVLGTGMGLFYPSATTAGVTAIAAARRSLGGGLIYMFQIAGGAVGLGLTTTVFASTSESTLDSRVASASVPLTEGERDAVQGILAGTDSAKDVLERYPDASAMLLHDVRDAFVDGFQNAFRLDTALACVGVVIAVVLIGRSPRLRRG
jgi:TRAP-type uncharacterized transport system fused permease subunit